MMKKRQITIPTVQEMENLLSEGFFYIVPAARHNVQNAKYFCFCSRCEKEIPNEKQNGYRNHTCPHCLQRREGFVFYQQDESIRVAIDIHIDIIDDKSLDFHRFDLIYHLSRDGIKKEVKHKDTIHFRWPFFTRKNIPSFTGTRISSQWYARVFNPNLSVLDGHAIMEKTGLKEYLSFKKQYGSHDVATLNDVLLYMEAYKKQPQIELLVKSGFENLVYNHLVCRQPLNLQKHTQGDRLFHLPKPIIKRIREMAVQGKRLENSMIHQLETLYQVEPGLTVELFDKLHELELNYSHHVSRLSEIIRRFGFRLKDILSYLERVDLYQAIKPREALTIWQDYIYMCSGADWTYEKYPTSLKLRHDVAARDFEFIKDKVMEDTWKRQRDALLDLELEGDEYLIKLPESLDDLVKESKYLHHCVSSYAKRIAKGETVVLFLRRKAQPTIPYYTIELRNGHITQVKGFGNCALREKKALTFLKTWESKLKRLGYVA